MSIQFAIISMTACRLYDFLWVGMHQRNARQHISRCSASMLRKQPREALELFIFVLYRVKYRENQFFLYGSFCRISFI